MLDGHGFIKAGTKKTTNTYSRQSTAGPMNSRSAKGLKQEEDAGKKLKSTFKVPGAVSRASDQKGGSTLRKPLKLKADVDSNEAAESSRVSDISEDDNRLKTEAEKKKEKRNELFINPKRKAFDARKEMKSSSSQEVKSEPEDMPPVRERRAFKLPGTVDAEKKEEEDEEEDLFRGPQHVPIDNEHSEDEAPSGDIKSQFGPKVTNKVGRTFVKAEPLDIQSPSPVKRKSKFAKPEAPVATPSPVKAARKFNTVDPTSSLGTPVPKRSFKDALGALTGFVGEADAEKILRSEEVEAIVGSPDEDDSLIANILAGNDASNPSPMKKLRLRSPDSADAAQDDEANNDRDIDPNATISCQMCHEDVPLSMLLTFTSGRRFLKTRQQGAFCIHHRRHTAQETYTSSSYPIIDWSAFASRFEQHFAFIKALITEPDSTPSYYRPLLAEDIKTGKNRTVKSSIMGNKFEAGDMGRTLIPGYYGTRGARAMQDAILLKFNSELRTAAVDDHIVSARAVGGYVSSVLVPELGVRLIKEDMGGTATDEEARGLMEKSAEVGALVNEELVDVRDKSKREVGDGDREGADYV